MTAFNFQVSTQNQSLFLVFVRTKAELFKVSKLHHSNRKVLIIEKGSYLPWEQGHLLAAIQRVSKFQMASFPLKLIRVIGI